MSRLVLLVSLCASLPAAAEDWPQWRGPNRTDVSNETGLLQEWPTEGPKSLWTYDKGGLGYAGFSIVGERLYSMGSEEGQSFAFCLDVSTGKKVWQTNVAEEFTNRWGDGPRSTPSVDGAHVYCMFSKGTVACLQVSDGKLVWKQSMEDYGGGAPYWGYSESVLVDGDNVICTPGGEQGALLALNKKTGKKVWQSTGMQLPSQYPSTVKATINGIPQYIQVVGEGRGKQAVVGVQASDGKVLWESAWPGRTATIPTPIVKGNRIYISSGYGTGSQLLEIGDNNAVKEIWVNKVMKNHHGGVIEKDGFLYGYSDGRGWICQSLETGEMTWNTKKDLGKGAIGYADGRFYLVDENSGTVVLIDADSEAWKERGRFVLEPQTKRRKPSGRIWVHPVISNGRLFLRDQEYIYCFDVKKS
ncbi:MAG: PQQ-binding-like beta-propeller repeat protein [Planctomycetaceae bacterium]